MRVALSDYYSHLIDIVYILVEAWQNRTKRKDMQSSSGSAGTSSP